MGGEPVALEGDVENGGVPEHSQGMQRTSAVALLRRFLPLAILGAGLIAFFALGLHRYVSLSTLRDHQESLGTFVVDYALLASVTYMLVYAAAAAFSVPVGAVLTIAGGFMFGVVCATLLVVVGATLGATGVFLAARTALGDALRRRAGTAVQRLEAGFRENAFSYLLTLRLIPGVPFWLVNLVPAFFGVPLGTYVLATVIGIIPATVVYTGVGSGLGVTLAAGQDPDLGIIFEPAILLPLLGLAVLSLLPVVYRKIKARRQPATGVAGPADLEG